MFSIKEDDLIIHINGVNDEEGKSPSVEDTFRENRLYDFYDFVEECNSLSESQNGYYTIRESNTVSYIVEFYTFDDTEDNDMDGRRTGYAIFDILIKPNKAILKPFEV